MLQIYVRKRQLLAFQTSYKMSQDWPVAMLDGEADFIPFMDGKILLGATHETIKAGIWLLLAKLIRD